MENKEKNTKDKGAGKKETSAVTKSNSAKLIKKYKKLKKEMDEVRDVIEMRIKKGDISIDDLID
jgi:molybdenum-dependent DNA-binding transcriptional regulator ModE